MSEVMVIGAGMAGLLAANMLGNKLYGVVERQTELPNNHSAVLRFRSSVVADTLNIPFTKVKMLKSYLPWKNPVADALAYSFKTTGTSMIRSSTEAKGEIAERFIAPEDLIDQMVNNIPDEKLWLDNVFTSNSVFLNNKTSKIISTIPMPALMKMLEYKSDCDFRYRRGANITFHIKQCEAYCSLYVTDPNSSIWRISVTGDRCVVECGEEILNDDNFDEVYRHTIDLLGIDEDRINAKYIDIKQQTYSKILPIDDESRKRFIMWASDNFGIYSFGRFATWRPGLLMDDLVQDFRIIMRLIDGESKYNHIKQ